MSAWSLRLARMDDALHLPAISGAAGRGDDPEAAPQSQSTGQEAHQRLIRKGHCLTAHWEGEPVGFIATEPFRRELHIWELCVLPAHQGNGIGSGLLRACAIDARNSSFRALTLTTTRDADRLTGFYERLGFEEVTALDAHLRLASELALEVDNGAVPGSRCAMIRFLD